MKFYLFHRNSIVLAVLVALTMTAWLIGTGQENAQATVKISGVTMLILAFLKVRVVMREFMEVRHAPRALRLVCDVWCLVATTATTTSYLAVFF